MKLRKFRSNPPGQGTTEYILIVALIAVLVIGAIHFYGSSGISSASSSSKQNSR